MVKQRQLEEWNDMLQSMIDDPQQSANHMVCGMNAEQRQMARNKTSVHNWV